MSRKLRKNEYLIIQGWMTTELGLTGEELILFALIYSYAQDGQCLEWSYVDDFTSWFAAFGYDYKCENIDCIMSNLRVKGYVEVTKEGFYLIRHIKELEK